MRGKKFNVKRTTIDEALKGCDPNPSSRMTNFMPEVFVALCQGEFNVEPILNQKFPEFINQWSGGKEEQTF
jgi:hypothetical protein